MNNPTPNTVTVDEAVALMIHMDYIPEKFTLEEMLLAFQEEAEVERFTILSFEGEQSRQKQLSLSNGYKMRHEACTARLQLAKSIKKALCSQVENVLAGNASLIDLSSGNDGEQRINRKSLIHWASDQYGINLPEPLNSDMAGEPILWSDVTIKLKANNRITFSIKKGSFKGKSLEEVGLLNRKTGIFNHQGGILFGIALGKKFPKETKPKNSEKTAISKIRDALRLLTNIEDDPFLPIDPEKGWIPRFRIINDIDALDKRAEEKSEHLEYKDEREYPFDNDSEEES